MPDFYEVLQVSPNAEPEVIEKAYKALAMKYHPDRAEAGAREAATARLQRVNEAYAVLADSAKRAAYDATLPGPGQHAWERFLDAGLLGLFSDWRNAQRR